MAAFNGITTAKISDNRASMLGSTTMDDAAGTQARERLLRWMDDSREVLSLLAVLVESSQRVSSRLHHSEHETEVLRKELHELRKEISDLRDETGERQKAHGDVQNQLAELKKQNETLRQEKEEAAQAFARLLDTFQSTNLIAQKLGVTKSPFARSQAAAPPAAPAQPE
jgi:septal ring factor EnvC (AmiA/AmiB activator)